jgi:hypothetical protein
MLMEFHPSLIPISKVFEVKDEKTASEAAYEMIKSGFSHKMGYKILMPKEMRVAKRIGYTVTTNLSYGLKQTNQDSDIRYWTYHHDNEHYAIVLISAKVFDELGL